MSSGTGPWQNRIIAYFKEMLPKVDDTNMISSIRTQNVRKIQHELIDSARYSIKL